MVDAKDAAALCSLLTRNGIQYWVMGGWGVNALLGTQTREHHDLDVLVLVDGLPNLHRMFNEHGFSVTQVWPNENRWLDLGEGNSPSAFVAEGRQGIQLDVHIIDLGNDGTPIPLCTVPWPFTADSLNASGTIGGTTVPCVSAQTQIAMHQGYELPKQHERDLEQLRRFRDDDGETTSR